jgi:IS30 family transposase
MDLVVPLPPSQGGNKFAVVAVEYFTRWIEANPLATITSESVKRFFWQNIVCRFGVPRSLTVDNGKQFDSENFKDLYTSIGTKIAFASVYHPESNGAVERANRIVFSAISKTLFNLRKGKWIEDLPSNRLHPIQAPIWRRGNATGGDQISEPPHHKASQG